MDTQEKLETTFFFNTEGGQLTVTSSLTGLPIYQKGDRVHAQLPYPDGKKDGIYEIYDVQNVIDSRRENEVVIKRIYQLAPSEPKKAE